VLALPFGSGAALILDETALLVELEDVYRSERGARCLTLVVRLVRRGEAAVLARPFADATIP
jgi:hypothetical protein